MKSSTASTTVMIDTVNNVIHFYTLQGSEPKQEIKKFHGRAFQGDFYDKFAKILEDYATSHAGFKENGVAIILPDSVVATDSISIPTMRRKKMGSARDTAIEGIYNNADQLKIDSYLLFTNKQYATYGLSLVKKEIITSLTALADTAKIQISTISFESHASVSALQGLNPKLRSDTFLMMDVRNDSTCFAPVVKGRAVGHYSLPFGYLVLYKTKLAAEDMLFDHSVAEMTVQQAKEKAKAKQVTIAADDSAAMVGKSMSQKAEEEADADANAASSDDTLSDSSPTDTDREDSAGAADSLDEDDENFDTERSERLRFAQKKTPRVLPKFMLRPTPKNDKEYMTENFRIFVKWALNLIAANQKTVFIDPPTSVVVNIPADYGFIIDAVNEEENENKVKFVRVEPGQGKEQYAENLPLYGGLSCGAAGHGNLF